MGVWLDAENMKSWLVVLTQGGKVVQTIEKTQVDAQHAKKDEVTLENVAPGLISGLFFCQY